MTIRFIVLTCIFSLLIYRQNEKTKQDDALDDLSDILGDLKGMAVDMGSEIEKSVLTIQYIYLFVVFPIIHRF